MSRLIALIYADHDGRTAPFKESPWVNETEANNQFIEDIRGRVLFNGELDTNIDQLAIEQYGSYPDSLSESPSVAYVQVNFQQWIKEHKPASVDFIFTGTAEFFERYIDYFDVLILVRILNHAPEIKTTADFAKIKSGFRIVETKWISRTNVFAFGLHQKFKKIK